MKWDINELFVNLANSRIDKVKNVLDEKNISDEARIERIISVGKQIIEIAIDIFNPVLIATGFSGGNDSIVTTHFTCEFFKDENPEIFYANTDIGIEQTRQHIRNICNKYKWDLQEFKAEPEGPPKFHYKPNTTIRVPAEEYYKQYEIKSKLPLGKWIEGKTTYEEEVLNFGFPGAAQHYKMFTVLKRRPLEKYIKSIKEIFRRNSCILLITGIRHDESSIRAGYKASIKKEKSIIWVNPFYFCNKYDFELYRQEFGLPRNKVTDTLGYSGECLCGAYAKPGELELIKQVDIDKYNYLKQLENQVKELGHERCIWGKQIKSGKSSLDTPFMPMCVGCNNRI